MKRSLDGWDETRWVMTRSTAQVSSVDMMKQSLDGWNGTRWVTTKSTVQNTLGSTINRQGLLVNTSLIQGGWQSAPGAAEGTGAQDQR
ncbi:hypothetical protein UPYG_G00021070 [Umbra pygmaea]|uniref:Uncharacterized protein n=1 Tax=Umbra pygmaea TaxID=75934 RepID=A0ABD0XKR6_UMBPY